MSAEPQTLPFPAVHPRPHTCAAGYKSWRSQVWTDVDADRTGILPFIWEPNYGFDRYTEYALDVPMYFRYDDGEYVDATSQRTTFREFMEGKLPSAPGAAALWLLRGCFGCT